MARGIDYDQLALYLRVLGVANRVQLLRHLQVPQSASEIRLSASRKSASGRADRQISRQAVSDHLRHLEALGIVQSRRAARAGRSIREYMINHARLFVVADELRRLALMRPNVVTATATPSLTLSGAHVEVPAGPSLVLATGPMEGTIFPLRGTGPWTIGRDRQAEVSLPYDPFVSKANSIVEQRGGSFALASLPKATNGTRVNWRPLERDEKVPLSAGDAIGVGRSLLFVRGV